MSKISMKKKGKGTHWVSLTEIWMCTVKFVQTTTSIRHECVTEL